jgi:hypothetical protein
LDGSPCNDGNACSQLDVCQSGTCTGTAPVVCAASDQCHTTGTCDPTTGFCSNPEKTDGTACSDGNACTKTDSCQAGVCMGASPVVCVASDQCHDVGVCDSMSGTCSNPLLLDGTPCTDGNACTDGDVCQLGVCLSGVPFTCMDPMLTCDPGSGMCVMM